MNEESGGSEPPVENVQPQKMTIDSDSIISNTGISGEVNVRNDLIGNINSAENKHIDFNNKYNQHDQGPYFVYVEHKDKSIGRLFPIRVGHYLYINDKYKTSILDIKAIGRNRVKVVLNSRKAANDLVNHESLVKNNLISYVPKFYTERKGIVKMVDTYFSEEYLQGAIDCDRQVLSVKRMYRRKTNESGEVEKIARQMVIVSFSGTTLPQCLRINGVNFPIEPYRYPVVVCGFCLRYGHTSTQCRSTKKRCKNCGSSNHVASDCESEESFCVYCRNCEHQSISKECPYFLRQKRIKQIMADQNLSFKEAESIEKNPSYAKIVNNNRFQVLNNLDNFPELPQISSNSSSLNRPSVIKQRQFNTKPLRSETALHSGTSHSQPTHVYSNAVKNQRPSHSQPLREVYPKKRKVSINEPVNLNKRPSRPHSSSQPIIPNPYRNDFIEFNRLFTDQLTRFISSLIAQNRINNGPQSMDLGEINIRDLVSDFVSNYQRDNNADSDDSTF